MTKGELIKELELMSAEIKGILWDYKIEQLDSGDTEDWEFLVNFYSKSNKTKITPHQKRGLIPFIFQANVKLKPSVYEVDFRPHRKLLIGDHQ